MSEPLVSVVVNCFNGEKYLAQALNSIFAQTYQNWEIVFWDNQSTDASARIAQSYADPRLRYFYAPTHQGLYAARNDAIAEARGEFIAFLDVDDWWLPQKLARQIPLFADPEVGLVCSNYWIESERKRKRWKALKRPAPTGRVLGELMRWRFIGLLTLVLRRSALHSLAYPCDPRFPLCGDWDLAVRLAVKWKLDCAQELLAVFRLHGNNETIRKRDQLHEELGLWIDEMQRVEPIRSSPGFRYVRDYFTYLKAVARLLQGNRREVVELLADLPWSNHKLRLCAGVMLPLPLVRLLKN
jgi:glycosyltransferase involved in cell wall biosynthesis